MTNFTVVEYFEKYSVAPSPSRDYYGIKVIQDQIILYTWKISHGPHTNPIVKISKYCDFNQDKTMHDDIQRVFGERIFLHVQKIAQGNENTLFTLPKHLIKKLVTYLSFKDVLRLSTISNIAREIFNGDTVWEMLYKRQKMGLVYKDERVEGSSYGWKRLFKERQMHKLARNRKAEKLSSDHRLIPPRSSINLIKRPSSSVSLKNLKSTTCSTKTFATGLQTQKFSVPKSTNSCSTESRESIVNMKKLSMERKGCKSANKKSHEEDLSMRFESDKVETSREKFKAKEIFENGAKSEIKMKNFDDIISSDRKLEKIVNVKQKSNFSSVRKIDCKSASSTELLTKRFTNYQQTFQSMNKKKLRNPKSEGISGISETEKHAPIEKNHEVNLTGDFDIEKCSNQENSAASSYWRNRYNSKNLITDEKSEKKLSKSNDSIEKNKSKIYKKFSTPRKPVIKVIKSPDFVTSRITTAEILEEPVKRFADIKLHLKKYEGNNFDSDSQIDLKSNSSIRKGLEKTITRLKNQNLVKTEKYYDGLDSKSSIISSPSKKKFTKKKIESLKKK